MSDILVAKELRHLFKSALSAPAVFANVGAVTVLNTMPAGWVVPDEKLPATYVFNGGEGYSYNDIDEVERRLFLDVVLMARGGGDPQDMLDDMQLSVEKMIIDAGGFGLARSVRPVSAEAAQNQGAMIIGTRVLKVEITFGVTPGDPSL